MNRIWSRFCRASPLARESNFFYRQFLRFFLPCPTRFNPEVYMKKWCLFVLSLFACASLYASGGPEKTEQLCSKAVLQDRGGYFVLSDGSCWKVVGFAPRWRTPSEWWNNVELIPENYKCEPDDWVVGAVIQTYPKHAHLEVNEADASNQESLMQCTDLLVNTRTGQVLFGVAMNPALFLAEVSDRFYKDGYSKGERDESVRQSINSIAIYNKGHASGYKSGYEEGYHDAFIGKKSKF